MTLQGIDFKTPGLVLLDKDWTLIRPIPNGEIFVDAPWSQEFLSLDVRLAVEKLAQLGWEIAVISNQGGVGAGYKSLDQTFLEFRFLHEELYPFIKYSYFCPDEDGTECWQVWGDCKDEHRILTTTKNPFLPSGITGFRKPSDGMIRLAIEHYQGLDITTKVFMVGDRPEDSQAAAKAEIPFFWVQTFPQDLLKQLSLIQ